MGSGLLANRKLNYAFILIRILVLLAFITINLEIDGVDILLYEKRVLHSRMEQRSVPEGVRGHDADGRPYAQLSNDVFVKCTQSNINSSNFTVYEPVFNLTIPTVTLGSNITALIMQVRGSLCLDGVSTRERKVLLSGELISSRSAQHPMQFGELFKLDTKQGSLGLHIFRPGDLIEVTQVTHLSNRFQVLERPDEVRFVSGYFTPQRSSRAKLRNGSETSGQAVSCFMVFEDGDYYVFFRVTTWLNNIFEFSNGTAMFMGGSDAIRMKVNKTKSKTIHWALANEVLISGPNSYSISMLASVLKFHYSATMEQNPFSVDVRYGNKLGTNISTLAVVLSGFVLVLFLALSVYYCFAADKPLNFTLNNINGLSHLIVLLRDDDQIQRPRPAYARLTYNGSVQITTPFD